MRKVLYIVSTLQRSGPINVLYNIVKYLNKDEFSVTILTLSPEPSDSKINDFVKLGINIKKLDMTRFYGVIKGPSNLKSFVKIFQPDVVHTHGIRADLLSAYYLNGYQRCSTSHNYPFYDYPLVYGKLRGYMMSLLQIKAFKKIEFPIACSKTIANLVKKHGVGLFPIQNGIDDELYNPINKAEEQLLKVKLNLPLDKKIFVSVGNLIPRKNPLAIIKGFIASKASRNSILLLIGDGPLRTDCESLIKEFPNIKMIGQVDNVADYLKVANFMISASYAEGLPMAVLESLASGLLVCLSDIEPHREVLEFNKAAGQLFSLDSLSGLTNKINELLESQDDDGVSTEAISIIKTHLSAEIMSKKYEEVYNQLLFK